MTTTEKPQLQDFHIEGVQNIVPELAFEAIKNNQAVLIDVREADEVKLESIPMDNVLNHPMSVIVDRLSYISKEQNIIVACPAGVRSTKVANLLNIQGYPNVANLDGGLTMWKAKGLPFDTNLAIGVGCGCGCSTSKTADKGGCC